MRPLRAWHIVRDAELLGIVRSVRVSIGCPSCGSPVGVRMSVGVAECECGTATDIRALADGVLNAIMRHVPPAPHDVCAADAVDDTSA